MERTDADSSDPNEKRECASCPARGRSAGEGNEVACAAGITKFIRGDGNRELVLGDTTEQNGSGGRTMILIGCVSVTWTREEGVKKGWL